MFTIFFFKKTIVQLKLVRYEAENIQLGDSRLVVYLLAIYNQKYNNILCLSTQNFA